MSGTKQFHPIPMSRNSVLDVVCQRIHHKMRDYAAYRFTAPQSCAINIFFDLVQEYDETEKLHALTVLILRMFFNYDSELYLKDDDGKLTLVTPALHPSDVVVPEVSPAIWRDGSRYCVPIRGRDAPVVTRGQRLVEGQAVMGVLAVYPDCELQSHDLLFLEKFANRVGFCLYNKTLANRNARHILFLRKLTHDIGHNIVTPNMRLKLMLNQMERYVRQLGELVDSPTCPVSGLQEIREIHHGMSENMQEISGTFKNSALFLETLLRQSHFDVGHYVLRLSRLDICTLVVAPQFERYRAYIKEKKLHVDEMQPVFPGRPCMVQVDLGLISQVLANILSNAAKYASPSFNEKAGEIRCEVEIAPSAFGSGGEGVKVLVFSSGPHIAPEDAERIFDDNYRAPNAAGLSGTGHGLYFVREIVAEHGGTSGYEMVEGGNLFYFMLPRVE